MVYAGIFLIGAIVGIVCAKIMILLTSTEDARNYPLGGFVPAVLIVFDLGQDSSLLGAAVLVTGGLFGYYLLVTIWGKYMMKSPKEAPSAPHIVDPQSTRKSVSLGDYLK